MSVRVLLADDQRLVRESLGTMLGLLDGIELVASAADGTEAVALATERRPDVVLMDLRMPRTDGIEATRMLRDLLPETGVIALTTYADDESVLAALRAGARGYLTKDASSEDIRAAILCVASGSRRSIRPSSTTWWLRSYPPRPPQRRQNPPPTRCPTTSRRARRRCWC